MRYVECFPIGYVRRKEGLMNAVGKEEVFKRSEELMKSPSEVELLKEYCAGLKGLRKGSLVWIIWYAHLAKERPITVRPYKDPTMPLLGVFTTRSPARPCPLGLSLAYILEVNDCKLKVKGLDAVDGTPVLDIKLYYEGLDSPSSILKLVRS